MAEAVRGRKGGRVSAVEKARRLMERRRVVEMLDAGVPVRVVAETVKLSERYVRRLYRAYYDHVAAVDEISIEQRKFALRSQYEMLDARIGQILAHGPKAETLDAAGYTFRDWLAAVELARRLKWDRVRLDALDGPMPVARPGGSDDAPRSSAQERMAAVRDFIEGLRFKSPRALAALKEDLVYGPDDDGDGLADRPGRGGHDESGPEPADQAGGGLDPGPADAHP